MRTYGRCISFGRRRHNFQYIESLLVNNLRRLRYTLRQSTANGRADSDEGLGGRHFEFEPTDCDYRKETGCLKLKKYLYG